MIASRDFVFRHCWVNCWHWRDVCFLSAGENVHSKLWRGILQFSCRLRCARRSRVSCHCLNSSRMFVSEGDVCVCCPEGLLKMYCVLWNFTETYWNIFPPSEDLHCKLQLYALFVPPDVVDTRVLQLTIISEPFVPLFFTQLLVSPGPSEWSLCARERMYDRSACHFVLRERFRWSLVTALPCGTSCWNNPSLSSYQILFTLDVTRQCSHVVCKICFRSCRAKVFQLLSNTQIRRSTRCEVLFPLVSENLLCVFESVCTFSHWRVALYSEVFFFVIFCPESKGHNKTMQEL